MVDDAEKGKEVNTGENNGHIKFKNQDTNPYGNTKLKTGTGREKFGTMGFYTCA